MLKRFLFICLVLPHLLAAYDPLLVVVLMVKNEAPVMKSTLKPLLDEHHQQYLIFDTGSTDSTIAITQQLFEEYGVKDGVIVQEPFIDFATSRNRALDLTEQYFPNACFMLMIDAEWELHNYKGLMAFCEAQQNGTAPAYFFRIMDKEMDYRTARLIRCKSGKRFVGVVHEELYDVCHFVPHDIFIHWRLTDYGEKKTEKRIKSDIELLSKEHKKKPDDARTVFYLAQSYARIKDIDNARIWYEKRASMGGWPEEVYIATYRMALMNNLLGKWQLALHQLLWAHSFCPNRAEPLVCIAQRYKELNNKPLCELFARRALDIPYPHTTATLFIEKNFYLKERYELLQWATT